MDIVSSLADFFGREPKEIRFFIVGCVSILLYYGVFHTLYKRHGQPRDRALTIAFMLWFVTSFTLQKCWAFEHSESGDVLWELWRFGGKSYVFYEITCLLVPICERFFGTTSTRALIIVTTALFVPDYLASEKAFNT